MHGGAGLGAVGVGEVDVGSDGAVVQRLHGTEVVGHPRLREGLVALHQLPKGVQLPEEEEEKREESTLV